MNIPTHKSLPARRQRAAARKRPKPPQSRPSEEVSLTQNLRRALAGARCLIWHADVYDRESRLNWEMHLTDEDACRRLWPITLIPDRAFTDSWSGARFPEDSAQMGQTAREAIRSGKMQYTQEFRVRLADGTVRWLSEDVHIQAIRTGYWRLVGVCTDITERRQAESELRCIVTSARCLIWHAVVEEDAGVDLGLRWDLRFYDEAAALRWLPIARRPGEALAISWLRSWPDEDAVRMHETSRAALRSGQAGYHQEYRVRLTDGTVRWLSEAVHIEAMGPGRWRLVGVGTDITERKALEAERERMLTMALEQADRDPLTGLLNHRAFHARLQAEADRVLRDGGTLAIAVLDLDNFKFFNDAYGHLTGDDVLRQVASALRRHCRSYDVPARFGGDEFAVLMPVAGAADLAALRDRLAGSVDQIVYRPPGSQVAIPLSLSVGIALFPDDAPDRLEVLNLADARLLRAKGGGEGEEIENLRAQFTRGVSGFSMLDALVTAVDNKDRYTRRHSEDVLRYCRDIGGALGLDAETLRLLQIAALLHDVGKIGVSDRILRKPGPLTPDEHHVVQQHPEMGAAIVGAVAGLTGTLAAVRHHHERWDGGGYPDGLAGEAIPLLARIMAVADAFSAMTTDRPYRKGMEPGQALAILEAGAGTQWDARCVQAFKSVVETGREDCRTAPK